MQVSGRWSPTLINRDSESEVPECRKGYRGGSGSAFGWRPVLVPKRPIGYRTGGNHFAIGSSRPLPPHTEHGASFGSN